MKYYAGIGPRRTPKDVCDVMTSIARQLVPTGWCLRSGHAEGADQAFEAGAVNKEIFLPWEGFNKAYPNLKDTGVRELDEKQLSIARRHHPAWENCSSGAQRLLARNVPIILGETLDDPVTLVITWLPEGYEGGTMHALRIASTYGVPVFNMYYTEEQTALAKFILNVENRTAQQVAA